jgi:fibronectin-binding autotransporter adhesin
MQGLDSSLLRHSGGRTVPAPSRRCQGLPLHAIAIATVLCAASPSARALTLLPGDIYYPLLNSSAATLAELDMQGGTMRLSRDGAGSLTLTQPSVLREGGIFSYYPVSYDPTAQYEVHFQQGASLPGPASGSYAGATQTFVFGDATNEGSALYVFNHAAFTQGGVGALEVRTVALFTNLAGASYDIRNDRGISGTGGFVNAAGASIVKSAGSGTSTIGIRLDSDGLIRAESGILEIAAPGQQGNRYGGGRIETSGFASVSFSGTHTIAGPVAIVGSTNLVSQARLDINAPLTLGPGSSLYLYDSSQTQIAGTGRVDLVGTGGSSVMTVSQGAVLNNAGVIALGENTVLDVRGRIDGVDGSLTNRGGSVVVRSGASVATNSYTQDGTELAPAELVVNGTLDAYGSGVVLLSGRLSGSGTINGDLVVGCDPCATDLGTVFGPGNSPGTFTVHGGVTLLRSSELVLEVEKRADGSVAFDRLVGDVIWLDGKVRFEIGAGISDADLVGISFIESLEPLEFGSHFNWVVTGYGGATVSFDATGLHIESLGAVPEPGAGGLLLAGLAFIAHIGRRRPLRSAPGAR